VTTQKATLVYRSGNSMFDWTSAPSGQKIIDVANYQLLCGAMSGVDEFGKEIEQVIFDRSVNAVELLEFLANLPVSFRGDVLAITGDTAYLSSVLRGDGRILYNLRKTDVEFYAQVQFGINVKRFPSNVSVNHDSQRIRLVG